MMSPSASSSDGEHEVVLEGGNTNPGAVVRVGDTVRRPRGAGYQVEEAVLEHLERVGFDLAPRLLGIDSANRQVLTFIDGDVLHQPPWQLDDQANASALGELAAVVRDVHDALAGFEPPVGATSVRPIPGPGQTWNHADASYSNTVYANAVGSRRRIVGLIDWEFAAPGDPLYDIAGLVGTEVRAPRSDRDDTESRIAATRLAYHAVADGYRATDDQRDRLRFAISAMLADAADFMRSRHPEAAEQMAWKSSWFRDDGHLLLA